MVFSNERWSKTALRNTNEDDISLLTGMDMSWRLVKNLSWHGENVTVFVQKLSRESLVPVVRRSRVLLGVEVHIFLPRNSRILYLNI